MSQINLSFGSGGMSLSFNNKELTDFVQQLQNESDIPTKQAALHSGCQMGSLVWVFGKTQVSATEGVLSQESAPYVWLGLEMLLDEKSKLSVRDICPTISLPLNASPLKRLVSLLEVCLKHNFIASLLVIGSSLMAFHYTRDVWGLCYSTCLWPIRGWKDYSSTR